MGSRSFPPGSYPAYLQLSRKDVPASTAYIKFLAWCGLQSNEDGAVNPLRYLIKSLAVQITKYLGNTFKWYQR
jgi:hypothetical protein